MTGDTTTADTESSGIEVTHLAGTVQASYRMTLSVCRGPALSSEPELLNDFSALASVHAADEPGVRGNEHFFRRSAAVARARGAGAQWIEHEAVVAEDHH